MLNRDDLLTFSINKFQRVDSTYRQAVMGIVITSILRAKGEMSKEASKQITLAFHLMTNEDYEFVSRDVETLFDYIFSHEPEN